jgi:hypothetical protein
VPLADSWAFFADVAYIQKAFGLEEPGHPDCSSAQADRDNPDSIFGPNSDRTDGTYDTESPPPQDPSQLPTIGGPTPVLPFNIQNAVTDGLATPYTDAEA